MRSTRPIARRIALMKILMVALLGAALPVAVGAPASAAPGDQVCTIVVGGKTGHYLCRYSYTYVFYDGRNHYFVVGTDDAVWHIWQTSVGGSYSDWTSLGGVARSSVRGVTYSQSGSLVLGIWVTGTTGSTYCKWYNLPPNGGRWTPGQLAWSLC